MKTRTLTQADLLAEAKARFGNDPLGFAFQCPNCGDIATVRDFIKAGGKDAGGRAGQECIGRSLGALNAPHTRDGRLRWDGRGCDWAAYGLIPGPWTVVTNDGRKLSAFPLAEAAPSDRPRGERHRFARDAPGCRTRSAASWARRRSRGSARNGRGVR